MNLYGYDMHTGPEEGGNHCAYRFQLLGICWRKSNQFSNSKSLYKHQDIVGIFVMWFIPGLWTEWMNEKNILGTGRKEE